MSYYREIRLEELIAWLADNLDADTPEALAQRLFDRFDILTSSNSPS